MQCGPFHSKTARSPKKINFTKTVWATVEQQGKDGQKLFLTFSWTLWNHKY